MQPIPYFGEKLEGDWVYEEKIDGWRLQIIKVEEEIKFFGRRLTKNPDWTEKLKVPRENLKRILPEKTILDSELYSDKGRRFIPSLFAKKKKAEPLIYIFDVIFFEGEFLGNLPLKKRRKILESLNFKPPFFLLPQYKLVSIEKILENFRETSSEGVVFKELNSDYRLGKECPLVTEFWRKLKFRR